MIYCLIVKFIFFIFSYGFSMFIMPPVWWIKMNIHPVNHRLLRSQGRMKCCLLTMAGSGFLLDEGLLLIGRGKEPSRFHTNLRRNLAAYTHMLHITLKIMSKHGRSQEFLVEWAFLGAKIWGRKPRAGKGSRGPARVSEGALLAPQRGSGHKQNQKQ